MYGHLGATNWTSHKQPALQQPQQQRARSFRIFSLTVVTLRLDVLPISAMLDWIRLLTVGEFKISAAAPSGDSSEAGAERK